MRIGVLLGLLFILGAGQGQNLLDNPSFEDDLTGTWDNNGFFMERVAGDTVDGNFALRATYRDRSLEGPVQTLYGLKPNGRYGANVYVKLLNGVNGTLWQPIKVYMQYQFSDTGEIGSYSIAYRGLCDSSMGWIRVNGSMNAPYRAFNWVRLAIRGPDPGVNFLMDNAALFEVPENTNWLADSHTNIDKYRKSNVNISFTLPAGLAASAFDVQIRLKKHLFPYGAKVKDVQISKKSTNLYSQFIFNVFNWATVQSYKWMFDHGNRTNPDFTNAVAATDTLVANGLKVRAHNLLWDVTDNIPDWVLALSGQELRDELNKHVQYMCNLALGKVVHWDVMNEHTHGLYFEETLQDRNYTKNLYLLMKTCDNVTKLVFNDYQDVDIGGSTEEYYQLMRQYQAENIPVEGLGVQGHFQSYTAPDPTLIWRRLDRLGGLGMDVFMTEFDVESADIVQRADWIEDAMRAFFGHPVVKGVIYWSFWDQDTQNPNRELIQGINATLVESGQRLVCLMKKEWTTNVNQNLGKGLNVSLRGFQGDYQVIIKRSGLPVQVEVFSLGTSDLSVNIKITARNTSVNVVQEKDYVPTCVSHRGQKSLGLQSTTSSRLQLACFSVQSSPSGANEDDVASVTCGTDRVMTGCSSYQNSTLLTRKGEQIVLENGVAACKVYNGRNSAGVVTAVARCCKISGLACGYRLAGPSLTFDGAQAESVCAANTLPFGCSSYSRYPDMEGVFANDTANSCVAQSGNPSSINPAERSGSITFAACCSYPDYSCTRVSSGPTTLIAGDYQGVTCPASYVMVSCNNFAFDGRSGGARIVFNWNGFDECRAYMGDNMAAGSRGVVATATCCL